MQGCIPLIVLQPSPLVGGDSRNDLAVVSPYRAKTAAYTTLLVYCLGLVLQQLYKNKTHRVLKNSAHDLLRNSQLYIT